MPFESKVYNYNLPKESINQTPYKDPNLSKLLIADTKQIIEFKDIPLGTILYSENQFKNNIMSFFKLGTSTFLIIFFI